MSASINLFDKEHAAREKYVYFVVGLAGALFAYIGKDYTPPHELTFVSLLTMSALTSLTLCIVFGLTRMQVYTHGLGINRDVLLAEEEISDFNKSLIMHYKGEANVAFSNKAQTPLTTNDIEAARVLHHTRKTKDLVRMKRWFICATVTLFSCNLFLVMGFVLLIASKFAATNTFLYDANVTHSRAAFVEPTRQDTVWYQSNFQKLAVCQILTNLDSPAITLNAEPIPGSLTMKVECPTNSSITFNFSPDYYVSNDIIVIPQAHFDLWHNLLKTTTNVQMRIFINYTKNVRAQNDTS